MKYVIYLSLAMLYAALSPAARADAFDDANNAFAQGRYTDSANLCANLIKQNGVSSSVFYNLANAQARSGDNGNAILNYERARWLAPRDPDIAANLQFARKQAGLSVPDERWPERFAETFNANTWGWLASFALTVFCIGMTGAQLRSRRVIWQTVAAMSAIGLLCTLAAVTLLAEQLNRAILPSKTTAALISPFRGAGKVFEFPAGQTVTIEKTHGDFCFVRDAAGHTGWVDVLRVGRIASDAV